MDVTRTAAALVVTAVVALTVAASPLSTYAAAAHHGWATGAVVDADGHAVAGALVNALNPREKPEHGVLPDVTRRGRRGDHLAELAGRVPVPGRDAVLALLPRPDVTVTERANLDLGDVAVDLHGR